MLTLAMLVLGAVAARNGYGLAAASQDVARTNELVKRLERLLSGLKDVEVAQREYILTGDAAYIAHIQTARSAILAGVKEISDMQADARWLELLRSVLPQRFEEIDATVRLRQSGGVEAASQHLLTNRGQRAMDDIRRILNNMIAEENRRLERRTAAERSRFLITMGLFAAVLVISLVLLWSVFYLIRREDQRMRGLHAELERRVALRTEALERSNEDLQQFAYVASHDLKEPMRMIASYSTLLQRRYQGRLDGDADTYIGFIVDGVRRMNLLITDLLEYSRAGQSKDEQEITVEPEEVLRGVLDNLKVSIRESGAIVTHDPLPTVLFDPLRLSQLLQNLVANAIKYRSDGKPQIHISAEAGADETIFSVRDNGMGIPAEHQQQIFAIFKRLHGKDIEGTGIGLAMCKKIVERHGGRIWVESEPGAGSTFRFSIPRTKPLAAQEAAG